MTDQTETPENPAPTVGQLISEPRLRFAIYHELGTPPALLVLVPEGQEIKCELSGDGRAAELLREVLAELKEAAAAVNGEKPLEAMAALIRAKVESQNFKMERLPEGDVQIEFGIDLQSGRAFGKHKALHPFTQAKDDIGRNMQKAIQQAFDQPAEEHAASIQAALGQGNHQEAARLVFARKDELILFSRSRPLLNAICAIDQQGLEYDEANELEKVIVSLASVQHRDEIACDAAEQLLQRDRTLDQQARFGLRNMIAVGALKRGERETGLAMLRELLEDADQIDAAQRGWIWRNLSMALEPDDPEARRTAMHAVDAFLEAGDKQEAARSIGQLSRLQEHDEPVAAIRQFDQMLNLMSTEGVLNEEIRADILHGKARKLLEFGNSRAAFEAAGEAIDLRRGILGAEEGLISSLHLAAIAAANHDDQKSADAMNAEAKKLEIEIGSEHFRLARRVAALCETWDLEEANSLLDVARQTEDPKLYAGIHVAVASRDPSLSSLQRLGRMEGILKELDRRHASRGAKHPVRLAIAQILKELGNFSGAADWYHKILDDSPLDTTVRQSFVDALWKAEKWGEAAIYLRQQLEAYGDQPGLLFAYGRSLFEAGQLSEAVSVFTSALKLADDNPDLQQTIREYRERALELGGSIPPPPMTAALDAPVTLDELRVALKEFATFVSGSKRMDFWEKRDGAKKHDWRKRPEKHGQTLLHTYLKATFKERVDIFEEIGVGAGRLDLLVRFAGGVSAIIELKMCGNGYSAEYARSGEEQIEHYMANRKVHVGLLVVFDARQRKNGSRLISYTIGPKNTIEETTIDVRPTIKVDETSD
jgi:tetratricopeptide (TPR) repeat protein